MEDFANHLREINKASDFSNFVFFPYKEEPKFDPDQPLLEK